VNLTVRDRMLFRKTLRLRLDTTLDQLRLVRAALREMLLAHPRVTDDPARVRAGDFGSYSLDVDIFAYVNTAEWNDYLAVQEDLIMRILGIIEEAGTALALPSRTLYHTRDSGLDSERREAAERQVREWGDAHTLPFPDFPEDYRERITDTLDYPPKGSPDAKQRNGVSHTLPEPQSLSHAGSKRKGPPPGSEFEGN